MVLCLSRKNVIKNAIKLWWHLYIYIYIFCCPRSFSAAVSLTVGLLIWKGTETDTLHRNTQTQRFLSVGQLLSVCITADEVLGVLHITPPPPHPPPLLHSCLYHFLIRLQSAHTQTYSHTQEWIVFHPRRLRAPLLSLYANRCVWESVCVCVCPGWRMTKSIWACVSPCL